MPARRNSTTRFNTPTLSLSLSRYPSHIPIYPIIQFNGLLRSFQGARLFRQWYVSSTTYLEHRNQTLTIADLKTTTDDALVPYLTSLPQPYTFTQNHTKSNVRFVLGFSAVAIAAFTFYADRRLGWEATTSPWIISAVAAYFAINTVFTVWVWGVEAGEVFAGRRKSGETVCPCFSPVFWFRCG